MIETTCDVCGKKVAGEMKQAHINVDVVREGIVDCVQKLDVCSVACIGRLKNEIKTLRYDD